MQASKAMHHAPAPALTVVKSLSRGEAYSSRSFDRQMAYKYLFELRDGNVIETTGYQHFLGATLVDYSIDISSMVGCPMRCRFCESALLSFSRVLDAAEMVAQVKSLTSWHGEHFPRITCSFQGIGEACLIPHRILEVSESLLAIDERNEISIATVGARLEAFRIWRHGNVKIDSLQLSCSGTTEQQIQKAMPRGPKIERLIAELAACSESPMINRVKLNYILMEGFNDSSDDVARLIKMLAGSKIAVKISALNLTHASRLADLKQAPQDRARLICAELNASGVSSYVYGPFNDTNVSCGQLAFVEEGETGV